jgi:hypothetical protein
LSRTGATIRATLTVLILASVGLTGCGSTTGPSASSSPGVVAPTIVPASAAPSSPASPGGSSGLVGPSGSGESVQVDPSLLSFIPIGGNGLIRTSDPDTAAGIATDPNLRANASALMIAIYMPVPNSASAAPAEDFAVVSVIRLRDPHADDAWFRAWRDSYDGAVCAQAGGVARNSETTIGSHTVFVGSCAGGSFTYHTRVAGGSIVISINSIGPANLGRTVMERLAP